MESKLAIDIEYRLNGKVVTSEEVELNKHVFNPYCFSQELREEIMKRRNSIPSGKRGLCVINSDGTVLFDVTDIPEL